MIETIDGKGVISLVRQLDYERKSLYQLKVLAIDRGIEEERRTATATLLVRIEDAEDEPPVFTFVPSVTKISENQPMGKPVLRVIAVDGDRGVNNPISYSIVKGSRDGLFYIDSSTGIVSVHGKLDREAAIIEGTGSATYSLEIKATEMTSNIYPAPSVKTEVTIIIQDVNDERPSFKCPVLVGEINENALADMSVKFIGKNNIPQVYDLDQGINGSFSLSLEGEYSSLFEITPSEGINEAYFMIRLKKTGSLDYDAVKSMDLVIVAREKAPIFMSPHLVNSYQTSGSGGSTTSFRAGKSFPSSTGIGTAVVTPVSVSAALSSGHSSTLSPSTLSLTSGAPITNGYNSGSSSSSSVSPVSSERSSSASLGMTTARVTILVKNVYLLREDQRVRFVLRLAPQELREKLEKFLGYVVLHH